MFNQKNPERLIHWAVNDLGNNAKQISFPDMLKTVRKGAATQFAILLSLTTTSAISSQPYGSSESSRVMLMLKSVLLSKSQCEMAIKDYNEKIAPYFVEWRDEYREPLSRFETDPIFVQQERQVEARFEKLSERARIGVVKDCKTLLRQMSERYAK